MTEEELSTRARRLFHEGFSRPLPESELREIFYGQVVCHGPDGSHRHDHDMQSIESCLFGDTFIGLRFVVDEQTVRGDRVTIRFRARGVQRREFLGRHAGGATELQGELILRAVDGLFVEGWGHVSFE